MCRHIPLIILSLVLACVGCNRENWQDAPQPPPPQQPPLGPPMPGGPMGGEPASKAIRASGYAMMPLAPDEAQMLVVTMTQGNDVQKATAENVANLKKILGVAKSNGLEAADMRVGRRRIVGVYTPVPGELTLGGINVMDEVQLRFTDLDKIEVVLAELLSMGAIKTWDITYRSSKALEHRKLVLEEAVKTAKAKAGVMAAVLDREVGAPISVLEKPSTGDSSPSLSPGLPVGAEGEGRSGALLEPIGGGSTAGAALLGNKAIPAPGMMILEASVEVVFQLAE